MMSPVPSDYGSPHGARVT